MMLFPMTSSDLYPKFQGHGVNVKVWPPGSADMVCPHWPLITQVQHWAKTAQTDHVALTLEVMAPVANAGRRLPSVYQV